MHYLISAKFVSRHGENLAHVLKRKFFEVSRQYQGHFIKARISGSQLNKIKLSSYSRASIQ